MVYQLFSFQRSSCFWRLGLFAAFVISENYLTTLFVVCQALFSYFFQSFYFFFIFYSAVTRLFIIQIFFKMSIIFLKKFLFFHFILRLYSFFHNYAIFLKIMFYSYYSKSFAILFLMDFFILFWWLFLLFFISFWLLSHPTILIRFSFISFTPYFHSIKVFILTKLEKNKNTSTGHYILSANRSVFRFLYFIFW